MGDRVVDSRSGRGHLPVVGAPMSREVNTASYPADLPCRCAAYDPDHNAHTETQHTDCGGHGAERCGGCDGCLSMMASRAVNNAHSTRWRHMHCDNEPQHVQEFRDGIIPELLDTIDRVRALAERWARNTPGVGDGLCGAAILEALDGAS